MFSGCLKSQLGVEQGLRKGLGGIIEEDYVLFPEGQLFPE